MNLTSQHAQEEAKRYLKLFTEKKMEAQWH